MIWLCQRKKSDWSINLDGSYESNPVAQIGCSGIKNYSNFGSSSYSVVAFAKK